MGLVEKSKKITETITLMAPTLNQFPSDPDPEISRNGHEMSSGTVHGIP
jgi:hypothetical protein